MEPFNIVTILRVLSLFLFQMVPVHGLTRNWMAGVSVHAVLDDAGGILR